MDISLTDLEDAINFWRNRRPSTGEERVLCLEAAALATPYAAMIMGHLHALDEATMAPEAQAALAAWRLAKGAGPA